MQSPAPGEEQPHEPGQVRTDRLDKSMAEKGLGVLVDTKLTMSQRDATGAKKDALGRVLPEGQWR